MSGIGLVLVAVYAVMALAATGRSFVSIAQRFGEAPLAYSLSAVAAVVYILATLARHGFEAFALSPHRATRLAEITRPPRAALMLGAEGPGLPAALLDHARTVAIPIVPGFDSLNVATTSGIALAHFFEPDTN